MTRIVENAVELLLQNLLDSARAGEYNKRVAFSKEVLMT